MTGMAARRGLLAAILILLASSSAFAAASQRLMLAAGCYVLRPGGAQEAIAYCLDESLPAPAAGVTLTAAPAEFVQTAVRVDGGTPITLQAALDARIVSLEGVGETPGVKFRNLTRQTVEICITGPTVVSERGNIRAADLAVKYSEVASLVARTEPPRDQRTQMRLQRQVWETIRQIDNKIADERAAAAVERSMGRLLPRPAPPAQAPPAEPRRPVACDPRASVLTACLER